MKADRRRQKKKKKKKKKKKRRKRNRYRSNSSSSSSSYSDSSADHMDSDVWSSDTNSLDHHAPYTKQASTSDSKPFRDGPRYSADSVDRTGSKTSALVSVSRILLRGLSIEVLSVPMPDGDLSSEGRI